MDFRQKRFKKILVSLLLLIGFNGLMSQIIDVQIDVSNREFLKIIIFSSSQNVEDFLIKKEEKAFPNHYSTGVDNTTVRFFEKETLVDEKELLDRIKTPKNYDYLEYKVPLNGADSNSVAIFNNIIKEDYFFLNLKSILGFFIGQETNIINLSIVKDKKTVLEVKKSYQEIVTSPIYKFTNKFELISQNLNLKIHYNPTELISDSKLEEFIVKANTIIDLNFHSKQKELIFIFDSLSNHSISYTTEDRIVFHFNHFDDFALQKTIIHEFMHWKEEAIDSWINEPLIEYLSIKKMVESDIIDKDKFLKTMSEKFVRAQKHKEKNLIETYNRKHHYNALYDKGVLKVWMLDLELLNLSKNTLSIEDFFINPAKINQSPFKENANILVKKFLDKFIVNNQRYEYNKTLFYLGILLEENKLLGIKPKRSVSLAENKNGVVINHSGELSCLKKGDIVTSINGRKTLAKMEKYLNKFSNKKSLFSIEREGEKLKFLVENEKTIFQKKEFYLSFYNELVEKQKSNWNSYID